MATKSVVTSAPAQQNTMAARPVDDDVTIWLDELKAVAADRATPPQHETQKWHFSAWGFLCPFTTCFQGFICPCITIGKTQHRLHRDPQLEGYKLFNTTCLTYMCCACAFSMHPVLNIGQRGIKRRWGLQ